MQIQRNEIIDQDLLDIIYDEAVDFYTNYLNYTIDIFLDNEEEDWDLVDHDTDVHASNAHEVLQNIKPEHKFSEIFLDGILSSQRNIDRFEYGVEDISATKIIAWEYLQDHEDSIFSGAVEEYVEVLSMSFPDSDDSNDEEVIEAKGELIA